MSLYIKRCNFFREILSKKCLPIVGAYNGMVAR